MLKYIINEKTYTQKPLVLGQVIQLSKLLNGIAFPSDRGVKGIISAIGDRLPLALAIVLIPEGTELKDKDISAIAGELEFTINPETAIEAVSDFFACNPINSVLEKLTGMTERITAAIPRENGTGSSASSQGEILPEGIVSSGATR